ncbi:MAG: flagellar basal body L-ring protein FlgH [Sphingomonadales bacterium]|nr:flagellar basal body L-ring protein FlgH [Sphingomonadales bacterium]MDE2569030.1 flagellar basal body L-ring protein FlgH [Sphingomonadales bacterium]
MRFCPNPFPFALSLSKGRSSPSGETRERRKEQSFDKLRTSGFLCLAVLAVSGAPAHAKNRPPEGFAPTLPAPAPAPVADGAIFSASAGYAGLVEGTRARWVGDPLTILLVEQTTTSKSAGSKTSKDGGFSITPPVAGPLSFLDPNALKSSGSSSFNGTGNATQTSTLAGALAVTIAEVRSNGTALVKGEKRLLLSQGHEWVQFSGIVRLADIDADNRVASTRVADAHIEYAGNGSIQRASRQGWLGRFFSMISPF